MLYLLRLKSAIVNDKEYYRKLNLGIQASKMWNSLQTKSEIGLGKSEQGYQRIARIMAGIIARELGLDAELAECLVMCQGFLFLAYGKAGKKLSCSICKKMEWKCLNLI